MNHQDNIARVLHAILQLSEEQVSAFCRGNPFDKLLRSYDEFSGCGTALYRRDVGTQHYKMSVAAYASGLRGRELYGEHRIPLKIIIQRLIESDRSLEAIHSILRSNEVVLVTPEEQRYLDSSIANGGLGLRSRLPEDGRDRLAFAGIEVAPETATNRL